MSHSIWKFVPESENQIMEVPLGSQFLSVEAQGRENVFYALVNPKQTEKEKKEFRRYVLKATEHQVIELPLDSQVFLVKTYSSDIVVCALVNPEQTEKEKKEFRVHGTGHSVPEEINEYKFLGTTQVEGWLMFHVFMK